MEIILRIALMFFFIQFVVVITIVAVALLLAQAEVPPLGRGSGQDALRRGFAMAVHLPGRVFRSVVRRAHSTHSVRGIH
jgi:hypothetical protein